MAEKKSRKYGKNPTTLSNALKLVEALLALADKEITVTLTRPNAQCEVEWITETQLKVSGKTEQKPKGRAKIVKEGIKKEDLYTLLELHWGAVPLKPASNRMEAIQDVINGLEDLGILSRKPSAINQGFWIFYLNLVHHTKRKENLKLIEEKGLALFGAIPKPESQKFEDDGLDWRSICRQSLPLRRELTSNELPSNSGLKPKLDQVYVPLELVERKVIKEKREDGLQPGSKEEEKLISISEDSFFEEVLRQGRGESQGRRIAIIGEPGSGKTTRLQKIADWILEQDLGLPIWISLADLTQPSICNYIEEIWLKQTGKNLSIDALTAQKDRIWLLLDGVDEMTSRVERGHVTQLLTGWVQAGRVVMTCRVNVWEADKNSFSGFEVFRNLPFEPEQVELFIRKFFAVD